MSNNPFADPVPNAWESPRYGNAYEDEGEDSNAWSGTPSNLTTNDRGMNAWQDKTEVEQHPMHVYRGAESAAWPADQSSDLNAYQSPTNAYQYSGTRYNHSAMDDGHLDAYQYAGTRYSGAYRDEDSDYKKPHHEDIPTDDIAAASSLSPPQSLRSDIRAVPTTSDLSGRYFALRVIQLLAGVGHLGFATGASPFSKHPVPFSNKSCFYYLIVVAIVSLIWSLVNTFAYVYQRAAHGRKMRRTVLVGIDGALTVLWGIGAIVELAKFHCPPGGYDKWCDFYNVGIFFAMLAFVTFLVSVAWDFIGAYRRR